MKKLLYVTVLLPRIMMLDWSGTSTTYMDIYVTQDCDKFEYYEEVEGDPGENCECCEGIDE